MSEEEQKKDPMLGLKFLDVNESVEVELTSATPRATGETQYGVWNLWTGKVENVSAESKDKKRIDNYTGDVVIFPTEKLHEKFLAATNGTKEGVKVKITLEAIKGSGGAFYSNYKLEKLSDGASPPNSITDNQLKFIEDFKTFVTGNVIRGTKDDFVALGKSDSYKIDGDTLEKLWVVYEEKQQK